MLIGVFIAVFFLFFASLAFRRLHARRCDMYLVPLAKLQGEILAGGGGSSPSGKKSNSKGGKLSPQNEAQREQQRLVTADGAGGGEITLPVLNIADIYSSLQNGSDAGSSSNSASLAGPLFTHETIDELLAVCPTITLSLGGQRVVWTRHAALMRRVLLTHFRLYPGPPTKSVLKAEEKLSAYGSDSYRSAALVALLVQRENQQQQQQAKKAGNRNEQGSDSVGRISGAVAQRLFNVVDGERVWDHVTWQGGFKPGEMPDIPALLLRGMLQSLQDNADEGQETTASRSSSSSSSAQGGNATTSATAILDAVARDISRSLLRDAVGAELLQWIATNAGAAAFVGKDFSSCLADVCTKTRDLVAATTSASPAPAAPASSSTSVAAKAGDVLLCATYAFGLSPYSRIGAALLSFSKATRTGKLGSSGGGGNDAVVVVERFKNLCEGLQVCIKKSADDAFKSNSASTFASGACGVGVVLQNCGSNAVLTEEEKASASARAAKRWDALLRSTIADKTGVVLAHLAANVFDVCARVLREMAAPDAATGLDAQSHRMLRRLQAWVKATRGECKHNSGNSTTEDDDESVRGIIDCFVREALRLAPPVTRAVRVAEGDDPQRADVFGHSPAMVVKVCGVGISAADEKSGNNKSAAAASSASSADPVSVEEAKRRRDEATQKAVTDKLDASIRLSNNGFLCVPSSAVVVCDVVAMMRHPDVFYAPQQDPNSFCPSRWESAATRRQEMEANFAPFGFGAAAEMALRYVLALSNNVIRASVLSQ